MLTSLGELVGRQPATLTDQAVGGQEAWQALEVGGSVVSEAQGITSWSGEWVDRKDNRLSELVCKC